jgi:hypothetical protein
MSFNLPTSIGELRGAEYVNRRVLQIPSTREINAGNFFRSDQTFRFNIAGNSWWSPSQSYFRVRARLVDGKSKPLLGLSDIAPSFCFVDTLYRSCAFSMNGVRVSSINDYVPQIAALKNRHGKSKDYRKGVGNSLGFYDTDFKARQARVISDGLLDETKNLLLLPSALGFSFAGGDAGFIIDAASKHLTTSSTAGVFHPFLSEGDVVYITQGANPNEHQLLRITARLTASADNKTKMYLVDTMNETGLNSVTITAMSDANFRIRRALEIPGDSAGSFECVWSPPLGISECGHYLPSGQYEYILSPQQAETAYKLAIESSTDKVQGANADFQLFMDSIELYVITVEQARVDSLDYLIDLKEVSCVPFTLTTNSWSSNMLIVPPSTSRLTVAYQDTKVSSGTQYPITKFRSGADVQNLITRFNVTYGNVVYPSNDLDLVKTNATNAAPATSHFTAAYNDMLLANGSAFSDTTSEDLREWLANGFYLSYPTNKEAKDTSTQVVVKQSFSGAIADTQLLLFSHYNTITSVSIKSGQVVAVSSVDA